MRLRDVSDRLRRAESLNVFLEKTIHNQALMRTIARAGCLLLGKHGSGSIDHANVFA